MAQYSLSHAAERDLMEIADFTDEKWGRDQAIEYVLKLRSMCAELAQHPGLGRSCSELRRGLHRMECGRHTIFYRKAKEGIFVFRFLHQRMMPTSMRMRRHS